MVIPPLQDRQPEATSKCLIPFPSFSYLMSQWSQWTSFVLDRTRVATSSCCEKSREIQGDHSTRPPVRIFFRLAMTASFWTLYKTKIPLICMCITVLPNLSVLLWGLRWKSVLILLWDSKQIKKYPWKGVGWCWYLRYPQIILDSLRIHRWVWINTIQYLLIPLLVGWTSIYQLFWCSPGVQGFHTLPDIHPSPRYPDPGASTRWPASSIWSDLRRKCHHSGPAGGWTRNGLYKLYIQYIYIYTLYIYIYIIYIYIHIYMIYIYIWYIYIYIWYI